MLDAPVSGGVPGAVHGTLQVMVGGDEGIYQRAKPALEAIGKVGYMGSIGAGTIAKLVHNAISLSTRAIVAGAFTLGVKAGVQPEALLEAVRGGSFGQGNILSRVLPNVVFTGDFDTQQFALRLARKDVGLATELAREFDVPMALISLVEQLMVESVARGWGERDSNASWEPRRSAPGSRCRVQVSFALDGVRVLALARFQAGPRGGMLLSTSAPRSSRSSRRAARRHGACAPSSAGRASPSRSTTAARRACASKRDDERRPADDAGRLPPGPELLELPGLVAARGDRGADFLTAEYFQRIARTLEDGRFHLAFFDDRLAMPDRYGDDPAESLRHGIRVVKMDLIPLLTAMGLATRHLGLGGTYSTTYFEPFHVARTFATLDHMIGGRAAWNIVTSLNDSEAANFGGERTRARRALRPRRRVRRGRAGALGRVGGRRDRARPRRRRLRRSGQGPPARPPGTVVPEPRAVHRAALAAGPAGADPGRPERAGAAVRGAVGRALVRDLPEPRVRAPGVRRDQGRGGRGGPRSRARHPGPGRLLRRRRDARDGRGQAPLHRRAWPTRSTASCCSPRC